VAQLGARVNGIHEVTGSIPVWSTNLSSSDLTCELRLGERRGTLAITSRSSIRAST
jgi:hypothetical protein